MKTRITGNGNPEQKLMWNPGKPIESGYFMAAWTTQSGQKIVSELWFNLGDGIGTWWAARGYLESFGGPSAFLKHPIPNVYAWTELPEAPSQDHFKS